MTTINNFREQKDDFFASHPQSPLTHEQKTNFEGLKYFGDDPDFTYEVEIKPFDEQEQIQMQTSTGDIQTYLRYGKFKFAVNGDEAELTVYSNEHGFFLPFVDAQAGKETYGAGRYLEPAEQANGKFHVDFNYAYNPYCAYNENYSCPIPPFENRLKVPIKAGEKIYK